ncbi:MAG: DUF5683 domain-containing protein, partial [Ignavibacteria bacterium]|nr:DUF5683 domain-containing protein [Ignavibacteria bacterium]
GKYSESDLIQIRDFYRRNTELSIIFLGVWYVLNIVDATVDAHFFNYDISDNLSLHLQPATITPSVSIPVHNQSYSVLNQPTIISLKFNF